MALRELGGDAISFTGSQSGIITNDRHSDARIVEVRPFRVQDELARGKVVVVAGYQGVSYRKEVTTLGRGGSDTTAVALAAALGAEWCEICSDVDGVYTADPRVVPAARRIPSLSYEETQEMAEAGAKVLNAQAVEFAKEKNIAIYARLTAGPLPGADPAADGTVVRRDPPRMPGTVVGVASERDVLVLHGRGYRGAANRALAWLDAQGIVGKQLQVTSLDQDMGGLPDAWTMVLSRENLHGEKVLWEELKTFNAGCRPGEGIAIHDGFGAVSAIGAGINATYRNLLAGGAALADAGLPVAGLSTSSFRITWLVPRDRLDEAVRRLHGLYLEQPSGPPP